MTDDPTPQELDEAHARAEARLRTDGTTRRRMRRRLREAARGSLERADEGAVPESSPSPRST